MFNYYTIILISYFCLPACRAITCSESRESISSSGLSSKMKTRSNLDNRGPLILWKKINKESYYYICLYSQVYLLRRRTAYMCSQILISAQEMNKWENKCYPSIHHVYVKLHLTFHDQCCIYSKNIVSNIKLKNHIKPIADQKYHTMKIAKRPFQTDMLNKKNT